jgi:hypothetical protein
MKAYRLYPNTRTAWGGNLELWNKNPGEFIGQLGDYLNANRPSRFRWHVGGDIPDQVYADAMKDTAGWFPETSFLCFTKRYELDFDKTPDNLNFVLSAWPGLELANPLGLPTAWLTEDERAPLSETHIRCPGHCGECQYKCWGALGNRMSVIFNKH